jgi:hypothetical protein
MKINAKYYFMTFILLLFVVFNVMFFTQLKKDLDNIIEQNIVPVAGISAQERMKNIMSKSYYFKSDIDQLVDIAFYSYKDSLVKRNFISDTLKNVMLLNYKIVLVDNVNSRFISNYLINLCLLFSFLFAILFKEKTIVENRHEPQLDIS